MKITEILLLFGRNKPYVKRLVESYGLELKTITKDPDGFVVVVTGDRSDVEHLTRDTE